MSKISEKKVVFVLGPPGAGKGTQCRKISETYGFVHVSAGELLRKETQISDSQHGKLIDSCIRNGKIVPAEITCTLLYKFMGSSPKKYFLIDGFPRNEENRNGWYKIVGDRVEILFILFIDCPVDVCIDRCLNRGISSGNIRSDDTAEILKKRIKTYIIETQPTVDYFKRINMIKFVDGNHPEDSVFEQIQNVFNTFGLPIEKT